MSHANAALTPRHRLKVAQLVVEEGWPISEVAARFQVSWPTVKRWAERYRNGESMGDRSSRPHYSPNKIDAKTTRRCISLRLRLREGPVQLACRLGIAPYRPQTNGKIERFHRTLADGWAYARCYTSEAERRGELDGWLHYYNHHRPRTACGTQPPFSRLINVPGQYI